MKSVVPHPGEAGFVQFLRPTVTKGCCVGVSANSGVQTNSRFAAMLCAVTSSSRTDRIRASALLSAAALSALGFLVFKAVISALVAGPQIEGVSSVFFCR